MNKKVLLIGNCINRINNNYSWENLIDNLILFIGAKGQISKDNKPFPLLYEEIVIEAIKNSNIQENTIKKFIANETSKLKQNSIHKEIVKLKMDNILTANYDFTIEKTINKSPDTKDYGVMKQTVYSLFRHTNNADTKVWHIHGDSRISTSIMLGYEQYSGYLQRLREYVLGNRLYKTYKPDSIKKKFDNNSFNYESWVEFFFTHDIHILGLTFDYVEMHLWWLLTYRARRKQQKNFPINNKIFFYYNTNTKNMKHKLELLKSYDVIPFSIKGDNEYEKFYKDALKKIAPQQQI